MGTLLHAAQQPNWPQRRGCWDRRAINAQDEHHANTQLALNSRNQAALLGSCLGPTYFECAHKLCALLWFKASIGRGISLVYSTPSLHALLLQKLRVSRAGNTVEGHPYLRLLRAYLEALLPRDGSEDPLPAHSSGAPSY